MLKFVALGFVAAVVLAMMWVRLAPSKVEVWHNPDVPMMEPGEYSADGSHLVQRVFEGDATPTFVRLDQIIRATPRTTVLTGSVAEGRVTYITRTRWMGFPDYTTVTFRKSPIGDATTLQVFGRSRFGKSDMGVNKARIEGWLADLNASAPTGTPTE